MAYILTPNYTKNMGTKIFNRYLQLDGIDKLEDVFLERGVRRLIGRNEVFLHEGQKSDIIGYVRQGGFRHLLHSSDGSVKVAGYSFDGDFITSFKAFDSDTSAVTLQAIRRCIVYVMDRDSVSAHLSNDFRFELYRASLSDIYGRLLLMHAGSPEERYLSLIEHYPAILEEVSLREIASYLRMAPETLSRIRKKVSVEEQKLIDAHEKVDE